MRIARCGLFVLCLVSTCQLSAAPPRLLPAGVSSSPQKSVLVRPQPASTTPTPTLAPVPATEPLQPAAKSVEVPQLAPVKPAEKTEADWQRIKDPQATESQGVVPASATAVTVSPEPKELVAQPLMQSFLQSQVAAGPGQQTTGLHDLLARANGSSIRFRVVKAYWDWTFHCAQQRLYEQQMKRFETIAAAGEGEARVEVAQALLRVRQRQNELDLTEVRHQLATLALVANTDLSWPADLPVVGRFRTEYEILFQNRQAPPALEKINLSLPKIWQLLASQAAAVKVLQQSLEQTEEAYQAGETSLVTILADLQQFEEIQQQYLQTARRYNVEIADYVIAVTGQTSSRERLVTMLIKPKRSTQSVLVPRR